MTQPIKTDFEGDFRKALEAELVAWGHPVPPVSFSELVALYANLKRRRIEAKPRTVHVAPNIVVPASVQAGYDLVTEKAKSGLDLNPHLSGTVQKDAAYDDMMLNDWVMHHLHLGTMAHPSPRRSPQNRPLLIS